MGDISSVTENVSIYDEAGNLQGTTSFPIIIKQRRATSPALTTVASSASSVSLLASNTSRIRATITNNSASILYVAEGATSSSAAYSYKMFTDDTLIIDDYTGALSGIWVSATGAAQVTEVT